MADGSGPILVDGVGGCAAPRRKRNVVWFAGGGGSSEAIRRALGCAPDVALNHWPVAIGAHMRHFPQTRHYCAGAFDVAPGEVHPEDDIGFGWFSPDCTDFSVAKGKALRSERRRGLAWVVYDWAKARRPDKIVVENVWEFTGWGPLYPEGHAQAGERIPGREGEIFGEWVAKHRALGAQVEWRKLCSADYGGWTTRTRLYVVITFDGKPIRWPARTHAPRGEAAALGLKPWRGMCEKIDWSIACPSIFLTPAEIKAGKLRVKRPLVAATLKRVARGIDRFVISAAEPFIAPVTHQGDTRVHVLVGCGGRRGQSPPVGVWCPMPTITGKRDACVATTLMVPYLVPRYGERPGQDPRCLDVTEPSPTVVPDGNGGSLVVAHLQRQFGSTVGGRDLTDPIGTVMPGGGKGGAKANLVSALLTSYYATGIGSDCVDPLRVATAKARHGLSTVFMEQANTGMTGHDLRAPCSTIVGGGGSEHGWGTTQRLVEARLELEGGPVGRRAQVLAFLWAHFGAPTDAEWLDPLATREGRLKLGLVTIRGQVWMIVDIGLRMLVPRELAGAMGHSDDFDLEHDAYGRPISKTDQTHLIGNMVEVEAAAALISSLYAEDAAAPAAPERVAA